MKYDTLTRRVRAYAMDWYTTTPEDFDIDWSIVDFRVSARMTRAFGTARRRAEDDMEIVISKHAIDGESWERIQNTIRHEAIHIWQFQTEDVQHGHNASFDRWAAEFGCSRHADKQSRAPKYVIICEDCGKSAGRQRRSKTVKHPHRYSCACGGDIRVERGPGAA